mmetsp:Transcript_84651/g.218182  ORF Transcript_84651/g.218182 Transcript_84651/m.218182 type:complete len:286 (+) Transcript_84651:3-860(+)
MCCSCRPPWHRMFRGGAQVAASKRFRRLLKLKYSKSKAARKPLRRLKQANPTSTITWRPAATRPSGVSVRMTICLITAGGIRQIREIPNQASNRSSEGSRSDVFRRTWRHRSAAASRTGRGACANAPLASCRASSRCSRGSSTLAVSIGPSGAPTSPPVTNPSKKTIQGITCCNTTRRVGSWIDRQSEARWLASLCQSASGSASPRRKPAKPPMAMAHTINGESRMSSPDTELMVHDGNRASVLSTAGRQRCLHRQQHQDKRTNPSLRTKALTSCSLKARLTSRL